jgi:hypothetical protein
MRYSVLFRKAKKKLSLRIDYLPYETLADYSMKMLLQY